ncbi:unnamed protein product, partial [Laminaria digitata]
VGPCGGVQGGGGVSSSLILEVPSPPRRCIYPGEDDWDDGSQMKEEVVAVERLSPHAEAWLSGGPASADKGDKDDKVNGKFNAKVNGKANGSGNGNDKVNVIDNDNDSDNDNGEDGEEAGADVIVASFVAGDGHSDSHGGGNDGHGHGHDGHGHGSDNSDAPPLSLMPPPPPREDTNSREKRTRSSSEGAIEARSGVSTKESGGISTGAGTGDGSRP